MRSLWSVRLGLLGLAVLAAGLIYQAAASVPSNRLASDVSAHSALVGSSLSSSSDFSLVGFSLPLDSYPICSTSTSPPDTLCDPWYQQFQAQALDEQHRAIVAGLGIIVALLAVGVVLLVGR